MTTEISLVEELNLAKNQADPHAPFFTGWKSADPNFWLYNREPDESLGYCGQMVQWLDNPIQRAAYVNLPGGESGIVLAGNSFYIGEERLYTAPSVEEMRDMLIGGLVKLKEIVAQYEKENADAVKN